MFGKIRGSAMLLISNKRDGHIMYRVHVMSNFGTCINISILQEGQQAPWYLNMFKL